MSGLWVVPSLRASEDIGEPDLAPYRNHTVALLRRYFRMAHEVGRMPSILGREVFRAKVTDYRASSLEEAVIFVHDVERCLDKVRPFSRAIIGRIILQDFTHEEAARLLGCVERTVRRRLREALDEVSVVFLGCGLLVEKPCQEAKTSRFELND